MSTLTIASGETVLNPKPDEARSRIIGAEKHEYMTTFDLRLGEENLSIPFFHASPSAPSVRAILESLLDDAYDVTEYKGSLTAWGEDKGFDVWDEDEMEQVRNMFDRMEKQTEELENFFIRIFQTSSTLRKKS